MTDEGPRWPSRGRRLIYMLLADALAERIEDGTYPAEGRLPAEGELVSQFGVSRASVRRAVQELRERGLVATTRGKGTFVLPEDERGPQA